MNENSHVKQPDDSYNHNIKQKENHNTKEYIKYDSLSIKFKIKQISSIEFMITYITVHCKGRHINYCYKSQDEVYCLKRREAVIWEG